MVKILIIDDDPQTNEYLHEYFTIRKCKVKTVLSGKEGLDAIKEFLPQVVLLDLRLEDKSGLDVLKDIKALGRDIYVIMITVESDEQYKEKAIELGAEYFLRKPINVRELEGMVSIIVSKVYTKEKGDHYE